MRNSSQGALMILALFMLSLLITSAQANNNDVLQQAELHQQKREQKENVLENFSRELCKLIYLLKHEELTHHKKALLTAFINQERTAASHREMRASQVFAAASTLSAQVGQCLPPAQQQVLSLFSIVTGFAADALRDDEDYQDFKAFQAARQASRVAYSRSAIEPQLTLDPYHFTTLLNHIQQKELHATRPFTHAPNLSHHLMYASLERVNFFDGATTEATKTRLLTSGKAKTVTMALAGVSYALSALTRSHTFLQKMAISSPALKRLLGASTYDEHQAIITQETCNNGAFIDDMFAHTNNVLRAIIKQSLRQLHASQETQGAA